MFSRSKLLFGEEPIESLNHKHVAVFGVGGVGGHVVEALIRSGVGEISLVDDDYVCITNFNRQIIATKQYLGVSKVEAMKERILSINSDAKVNCYQMFFLKEKENEIPFSDFDYIVDAIDTVSAKIALVEIANKYNIPIISSMGAANKMDPMGFKIVDIFKTEMDPIAKVMRYELRKRGIKSLTVAFSKENPVNTKDIETSECKYQSICGNKCQKSSKKSIPGSNAFVPSACGLLIASKVIKDLTGYGNS